MQKTRVAVLRGGPSEEFDVSLKTGASVINAINADRFDVLDVVITKGGEWLLRGVVREPHEILQHTDVAFNALHGVYGEDGQVQRIMDKAGVRYTGSDAFSSAIAMNKVITKDRLSQLGINMARHMLVTSAAKGNLHGTARSISDLFGPKYVVKPVTGGSSVGTVCVGSELMLEKALDTALSVYDKVLVEEFIDGKEATCGVVEDFRHKKLYVLPPIEIVPPKDAGFFDYKVKYDGSTEEICPGRFTREEKDEIERMAEEVHQALELSQYSRSDFIVTRDGIYFLEVNTLPGLTAESLLPKALDAVGCSYKDFVHHLLTHALER